MIADKIDSIRVSVICPKCGEKVWVVKSDNEISDDKPIVSQCWKCKSKIRYVVKAWVE